MSKLQPDNHSSLLKEINAYFEQDSPICIKEMDISLKDNSIKAPSLKRMKKHYFSSSKNSIVKNSKSLFKELRVFRPFNKEVVDFLLPSVEEKIKGERSSLIKSLVSLTSFACLLFVAKLVPITPSIEGFILFSVCISVGMLLFFLSAAYIHGACTFNAHMKILKRYKKSKGSSLEEILKIIYTHTLNERLSLFNLDANKSIGAKIRRKFNLYGKIDWNKKSIIKKLDLINSHQKSKELLDMWKSCGDVRLHEFIYLYHFAKMLKS